VENGVKSYRAIGTVSRYLEGHLPSEYKRALEDFDALLELHNRYRESGRLSAPMTAAEFAEEFILDAWAGLERIRIPAGATVADVGSGGGYPGVPWSILRPDLRVTLIEANSRKAEYLKHVVRELGLDEVEVKNARAEHVNERYDFVVAKGLGVEALPVLARLVKPGGRVAVFALEGADLPRAKGGLLLEEKAVYVLPYRGTERAVAIYTLGDVSRETSLAELKG
jgi:16S rRNA (guanine(527)-N(7))-methyltransferase RsmG